MSLGIGFNKTTQKTQQTSQLTPAPETDLQRQVREANEQFALQQGTGASDLLGRTPGTLGTSDQGLLDASTAQLMAAIQSGGISLSPEQRAAFDQIFGNQADELQRRLREQATQIANTRGLALSDSPIANPLLAETQRGLVGLGAQRARGLLDFGQQGFTNNLALKQFQSGLAQQAFGNRLALLSGNPGSVNQQALTNQFRLATGTQSGQASGSQFTFGGQAQFQIPGTSSFQQSQPNFVFRAS